MYICVYLSQSGSVNCLESNLLANSQWHLMMSMAPNDLTLTHPALSLSLSPSPLSFSLSSSLLLPPLSLHPSLSPPLPSLSLSQIESNLGISLDNKVTPTLPQYMPPLQVFLPWVIKVIYMYIVPIPSQELACTCTYDTRHCPKSMN